MRSAFRSGAVMLGTAFRADPARAVGVFVLTVVSRASSVLYPLQLKVVLDAVEAGSSERMWLAAGAFAVTTGILFIASWTGFTMGVTLQERTGLLIDQRLIALTSGIAGLEHHERPDYLDEIEMLRTERDQLAGAVSAVVEMVATGVQFAGVLVVLTTVHPALLVLPLFAVPSLWAASRAESARQRTMEETTEAIRSTRHLYELATQAPPAKEIRVFRIGPTLVDLHDRTWRDVDRRRTRTSVRGAALASAGWAAFSVGFVLAIAFVVGLAVDGRVQPSEVLVTLAVGAQVNQNVAGVVRVVSWYLRSVQVVKRYLWLTDYATESARPLADPLPVPARLREGIEFDGVGFAYPNTDQPILRDVNVRLPAGSTVAVVGENGAGKTTLIKLLSRFYDPTEGTIRVDGHDLTRMPVEAWRAQLAAGFQDFARIELAARETVGVGELRLLDDVPAVQRALERASAADVVAELPDGLETQVGRNFADGVELSGGQWQKLALGRAMMRADPLLLILDEPTASLDPQTEHELFERYAGAARRAAGETGAITLLVSHRFSTVRMADLIVVVRDGTVTEVGAHADLVAAGGLYAELYELQARAYR